MNDFDDEFPEHAKLRPHFEANWDIRHFLTWLTSRGVFLARYNPTRHAIEGLGDSFPESLLLEWRGVDAVAYRAEHQVLDERYGISKLTAKLAPELGKPLGHMPPLRPSEPKITEERETSVPDAAQALLDKIRSMRK